MTTILVVDDHAVIREPIAAALRLAGYETFCVENGREALASARSERPDLILLDVAMPEMDGLALARALKADPHLSTIPIILLTGMADRDRVLEAGQLGVRNYLLKSDFSLTTLLERVRRVLDQAGSPRPCEVPADNAGKPKTEAVLAGVRDRDPTVSAPASPPESPEELIEAVKSLKPLVNRSELRESVEQACDLRALSPTANEVLKLAGSELASVERLAKVIRRDHAIALKVLKLANSSAYTRGDPIDSIEQAVVRIGMSSIRQAVMNLSVVDRFSGSSASGPIDQRQFWEHSIACGIISARIARARGDDEPETAFTMGLLHDIGRVILAEMLGERYLQVLEQARALDLPVEQVESRLLLLNHADIMDRVLHVWKFPKNLIDPIVFHHLTLGNMRRMAPRRLGEVATLGVANRLTNALLLGSSGNETVYPTEELCRHLKLNGTTVREIETTVADETRDMKFSMLSASAESPWTERREELRATLNGDFRPLCIATDAALDAHRIACERLATPGIETPNLAVVHLTSSTDRVPLTTALCNAEAEAGVDALPLILLSPRGALRLEESAMASRPALMLATPVTVSRLIRAANSLLSGAHHEAAA